LCGGVCWFAAGFEEEAGVVEAAGVFGFVAAGAGVEPDLPGLAVSVWSVGCEPWGFGAEGREKFPASSSKAASRARKRGWREMLMVQSPFRPEEFRPPGRHLGEVCQRTGLQEARRFSRGVSVRDGRMMKEKRREVKAEGRSKKRREEGVWEKTARVFEP